MVKLDYELARTRALKSKLVEPDIYERLIDSNSIEEMVSILSDTVYKDDITAAMVDTPGYAGIEKGLKDNLSRSFSKIAEYTTEEAKPLIRVLLGRFDVWNIKTIIRGKHVGTSVSEITSAVLPAGELDEPLVAKLSESAGVKAVIDLLSSWSFPYSRVLREAYRKYKESGKLVDIELPLDIAFYQETLETLEKMGKDMNTLMLKEFFSQEIDFTNILTALRLSQERYNPDEAEKFFIEGGRKFDLSKYKDLIREGDPAAATSVLARTPYSEAAEDGLKRYSKNGLVSSFQRALEEYMMKAAHKLFLTDPLYIGIVIAYIWTKRNEVMNLRIIVRGKSVEMGEKAIREALVIV